MLYVTSRDHARLSRRSAVPRGRNSRPGSCRSRKSAANAAKEGGFFGIGGTAVSDKEEAAITQLGSALGVPP
jgi:hypothetical protein